MKMEDHYLHVTTDEGRGMTLHRLSDACRELDGTGGLQVHRSWWVARGAVRGVRQENRRRIITAVDGTEIPVGRSYEAKLREAGWF